MFLLLRVVWEWALLVELGDRVAVLARDMPAHGIVAGEGARAVGARHAYALVPLPDVGAKVRLVAVQPLAVWALQLLT